MNKLVATRSKLSYQFKKRYLLIDVLRGLGIIGFLIHHFVYDLSALNLFFSDYYQVIEANPNLGWIEEVRVFCFDAFFSPTVLILESIFSIGFISISGISTSFTKHTLKHGIFVFLIALCFTGVSFVGSRLINSNEVIIYFGILHCIGLGLIIVGLIDLIATKFKKKAHPSIFIYLGFVVYIIGVFFNYIYGFDLDKGGISIWKIVLGMQVGDADWFPIFPFCGFLFIGAGIGKLIIDRLQNSTSKPKPYTKIFKPLAFLGKHSLFIYIIHQLIYIPIIAVVMVFLGFHVL